MGHPRRGTLAQATAGSLVALGRHGSDVDGVGDQSYPVVEQFAVDVRLQPGKGLVGSALGHQELRAGAGQRYDELGVEIVAGHGVGCIDEPARLVQPSTAYRHLPADRPEVDRVGHDEPAPVDAGQVGRRLIPAPQSVGGQRGGDRGEVDRAGDDAVFVGQIEGSNRRCGRLLGAAAEEQVRALVPQGMGSPVDLPELQVQVDGLAKRLESGIQVGDEVGAVAVQRERAKARVAQFVSKLQRLSELREGLVEPSEVRQHPGVVPQRLEPRSRLDVPSGLQRIRCCFQRLGVAAVRP